MKHKNALNTIFWYATGTKIDNNMLNPLGNLLSSLIRRTFLTLIKYNSKHHEQ